MDELNDLKTAVDGYANETKGLIGSLTELQGKLDGRVSELEADFDLIRRGTHGQTSDKAGQSDLRTKGLDLYLRSGTTEHFKAIDADFANNTTTGGVLIPEVIASEMIMRMIDAAPMAGLVRRTVVTSPNYQRIVNTRGNTVAWSDESSTRGETGTPRFESVGFTHGELMAYPTVGNWALDDSQFNLTSLVIETSREQMGLELNASITAGNGSNKPTGFLTGTPVSTADSDSPSRDFGVVQYIPTGNASGFGTLDTGSPPFYPADVFHRTLFSLKAQHRANASWVMSSVTADEVSRFKDAQGQSIWLTGMAAGVPNTLLGYPVVINEDMPGVGANAFPVAFADWDNAYELIQIGRLQMTRDDVTTPGQTKFYIRQRFGGKLTNDQAIKLIKCATS